MRRVYTQSIDSEYTGPEFYEVQDRNQVFGLLLDDDGRTYHVYELTESALEVHGLQEMGGASEFIAPALHDIVRRCMAAQWFSLHTWLNDPVTSSEFLVW